MSLPSSVTSGGMYGNFSVPDVPEVAGRKKIAEVNHKNIYEQTTCGPLVNPHLLRVGNITTAPP